jgi:hypothetical protein
VLRLPAFALVLLVAAAAAAGCGGSQRIEYEQDLAKVGRIVDTSLAELPDDDTQTLGPAQVTSLAADLREAADQLDDLDPPDDAKDAQARLERGLRGVATAFDDLARDLKTADTDTEKAELFVQFATATKVDRAFDDVIGAQEAYARKGYRVFSAPAPPKRAAAR